MKMTLRPPRLRALAYSALVCLLPACTLFSGGAPPPEPVVEPLPPPTRVVCAEPVPPAVKETGPLTIGATERVILQPEGIAFEARIDTGAETSSMGAANITEFERDGKTWVSFDVTGQGGTTEEIKRPVVRFARIKVHRGEPDRRPVVKLRVMLGPLEEMREFTLADRSQYEYPVLIGRNFIRDNALVDVSRENTQRPARRSESR